MYRPRFKTLCENRWTLLDVEIDRELLAYEAYNLSLVAYLVAKHPARELACLVRRLFDHVLNHCEELYDGC